MAEQLRGHRRAACLQRLPISRLHQCADISNDRKIAFAYAAVGDDLERAHTAIDAHWDAARTALAAWLAGHTRLDLFREPGQLRAGLAAALTPALFPDGEGRVVTASLQHVTLR